MRRVTESAVLAAASSGAAAAAAADALAAYRASPQGRGDCAPAGAGTVGGALALQAVFSRDVAGACAVLAESWAALMRDLADDLAPRAALLDPLIQARHDPTQLRADSGATSDGRTPLSAQQRDQQVTQLQLAWSELDEHALDESEAGEAIARIQFPV
ncbi:hypothetical protein CAUPRSCDRAFT_11768 [Caulochytrium protostelioides]|nr:hypothetical protein CAUPRSCDRAFT_11768 [Caulochytrium protostelioides]